MIDMKGILEKIESPLLFLSRNAFKNLHLVKELEFTMEGLIDNADRVAGERGDNGRIREILQGMRLQFAGFDDLGDEEKKKRIDSALQHLSELRQSAGDRPDGEEKNVCDQGGLQESFDVLSRPAQFVRGVGPKMAVLLSRKGIATVEDMLYFLPRRYEDRRSVKTVSEAVIGQRETVTGKVIEAREQRYRRKVVFEVMLDDGTGVLTAKWFQGNYAFLRKMFKRDRYFFLTGEIKGSLFGKDMFHPDYELIDEDDEDSLNVKRIVPVYSETEGLYQKYLRKIMMRVVTECGRHLVSPLPDDICRRNRIPGMTEAIRNVHFPGEDQDIEKYNDFTSPSHRRLVFDELFFFELGMALKKRGYILEKGIAFADGQQRLLTEFYEKLSFELTGAQKRVVAEILADMKKPHPMNRLIQGDVGSGKTVVSMAAMIVACESGYQSAIMAPTEILALQHFRNISTWAKEIGMHAALLTGSTRAKERKDLAERVASGEVDILIGTHALIQEGVQFRKLGCAVIDEQHRFGVMQRALLREKGLSPDVLVMTATPIPRTLAMTVYGDLDISVIDEMPPGKKPVKTKVYYEKHRDKVYDIIRREVEKGNQVFIIYPLVEESETLDLKDATTMSRHLQQEVFREYRVGLIHGKMKSGEKEEIMASFKARAIDILVSTTVVEVGIDIPSASLMIIEHAERFGLSQLHQLRGRVGRGDVSSSCILVAHHGGSDDARRRLKIMEQTNDGFKVAEEDLALRGPGEFMGTRQSGLPDFRVANILRDGRILNDARREAFAFLERDPALERPEHVAVREVLLRRWEGRLALAKTG